MSTSPRRPACMAMGLGLAGMAALGCVDWELLSAPLPDAGPDVDAGTDGCAGEPPDQPEEPAELCGSIEPLPDEAWRRHPFVATGGEPVIGARVDQLVVVEGEQVHLLCGEEEEQAGSPVECPISPRGQSDVAPDGSLVLGAAGGACVVRDGLCACTSELPPAAEMSAVAVVTSTTFVMLVQYTEGELANAPVLQERRLDDPNQLVGALLLSDAPRSPDVPVLTRLPRRCADPTTWAVAADFPVARRLFTFERPATTGGLTGLELAGYELGESLGIAPAPVGAAPGSGTTLFVTRVTSSLAIETRIGTLAPGVRADGAALYGGRVGSGDHLVGPCAVSTSGRLACTGPAGLLVVDQPGGDPPLVALPATVQRYGDASGSAAHGDDAWIFGDDFAAHTSLSAPDQPVVVKTEVVAEPTAGERVVGAALGDERLFVGAPGSSALVYLPAGGAPVVTPRGLAVDALALGASSTGGEGVLAWVGRTDQQIHAVAIDDAGNFIGTVEVLPGVIAGDAAAADPGFTAGTVSLWSAGLTQLDTMNARVTLQPCRASAASGALALECSSPFTVDVAARDDVAPAVAMTIDGDHLFLAAGGGVATVALNATRDGVGEVHSKLALEVNGFDPLAGGVRSLTRSLDCLYLAVDGRVVQPVVLWIGAPIADDVVRFEAPLVRELDLRALLTLGDDSILAGAERGRLARFVKDGSASACSNGGPAPAFAASYGPTRPEAAVTGRPRFVGGQLYVIDRDLGIWRVPLP